MIVLGIIGGLKRDRETLTSFLVSHMEGWNCVEIEAGEVERSISSLTLIHKELYKSVPNELKFMFSNNLIHKTVAIVPNLKTVKDGRFITSIGGTVIFLPDHAATTEELEIFSLDLTRKLFEEYSNVRQD